MASAGAQAYITGVWGGAPAGVQGVEPRWEVKGMDPPTLKLTRFFCVQTFIFNASAIVLHETTYCLSCFIFTATCFSNVAVMGSLDVRPSVRLSVCPSVCL